MFKEDIINDIIKLEGGYVYDPLDSGGETKFGITKQIAVSFGYKYSMKQLPHKKAFDIYDELFWQKNNCDEILRMSYNIAKKVFDMSVNIQFGKCGSILQRTLNVLNNNEKLYLNINVDGIIGSKTLFTIRTCLQSRHEDIILKMINCFHGMFYIELAEKRPKDQKFIYGWIKNRVFI